MSGRARIAVLVVVLGGVAATLAMKDRGGEGPADGDVTVTPAVETSAPAATPDATPSDAPATATDAAARTADAEALPRLIDLGADKCVPCKMMAPILDELRDDLAGQCAVQFIDVWKNPKEGPKYGIRVIPTQIFLGADGTELFRHEGFFSREDILQKFAEHGYEFDVDEG